MSERRNTRVTAPLGVVLRHGELTEPCMASNVSLGGMFVRTKKDIPEDTVLDLEIVHEGLRLSSKAKVASVKQDGLGLSFVDPTPEFTEQIRELIDKLLARPMNLPVEESGGDLEDDGDDAGKDTKLTWSFMPEEAGWNPFKKRQRKAKYSSLSLDGVMIVSGKRPAVGDTILVFIDDDDAVDPLQCKAEVVRHTDKGFAVKFMTPKIDFRRAVSTIRRRRTTKS